MELLTEDTEVGIGKDVAVFICDIALDHQCIIFSHVEESQFVFLLHSPGRFRKAYNENV